MIDNVQTLFLLTELGASTSFEHAVFRMFGQPVPHLAWVTLVGVYVSGYRCCMSADTTLWLTHLPQ